jgi:anti-anti-sigma factor
MLHIRQIKYPHTTLFKLTGQFDHQSSVGIETLVLGAHELGFRQVILDFSDVTSIDSISLRHLCTWYDKIHPHHVKLTIANPHPRIREVLESLITEIIPIRTYNLEAI